MLPPQLPKSSVVSQQPKKYIPTPTKQIPSKIPRAPVKLSKYDSESESEYDSDSDSEYDSDSDSDRVRRKSNKSTISKLIEVPTKELAELAIKTAIEKGEYNIRVVIV